MVYGMPTKIMVEIRDRIEDKEYQPKEGIYEMYIREIADGVAYCNVIDADIKKSFMEVPVGDLEKVCLELRPGTIFKVIVKNEGAGINFESIERSPMSREKLDEIIADYRNKYGDV